MAKEDGASAGGDPLLVGSSVQLESERTEATEVPVPNEAPAMVTQSSAEEEARGELLALSAASEHDLEARVAQHVGEQWETLTWVARLDATRTYLEEASDPADGERAEASGGAAEAS